MEPDGLRIAILTWDTPPMPSGLGRAAFEIAAALKGRGCDVTLIDASRPMGEAASMDGVAIRGCAVPPGAWRHVRRRAGIGHLVAPLFFRRALLDAHRERPFDVVEATNWYAPAALVGSIAPLVVRNSTPAIDAWSARAGLRDRADLRFAHRLEGRTARRAAALISNTAGHARLIERLYDLPARADHTIVPLALDPLTIAAGLAAPWFPLGPADGSPGEPPHLLFVGRAERRKGFEEALAAHVEVAGRRAAAGRRPPVLDIVGVEREQVDRRLRDVDPALAGTIVVHERIADAALHDLYGRAALVLAPSRYESFGLVYREAAAFGRPLVACAEDPAAREFVAGTGCGLLAETCAAAPIARAIARLLDDADCAERCRAAGLRAAATLSRAALAEATLAVHRRAVASQPAKGRSSAASSP